MKELITRELGLEVLVLKKLGGYDNLFVKVIQLGAEATICRTLVF